MAQRDYTRTEIDLTEEQLHAIVCETRGPVVIQRTKGRYTHTYVQDREQKKEGRVLHIGKKGQVHSCEGAFP